MHSLTTGRLLRVFKLSKLADVALNQVTCLTHRYILLHSGESDETQVLTMEEDPELDRVELNSRLTAINSALD